MSRSRFHKQVINTFFTRVGSQIFGFISLIVYARVLGPTHFGTAVLLTIIPPILVKFLNLGVADAVTFYVNQHPEAKREYLGTALLFGTTIAIASTGLLMLFLPSTIGFLAKEADVSGLLWLVYILSPISVLNYYFKSMLIAVKAIEKVNSITVVLNSILSFIFTMLFIVWLKLGAAGYLWAIISTAFIEMNIMFFSLLRLGAISTNFHPNRFHELIHFGLRGIFANISGDLAEKLDRLIIGLFLSIDQVGIYQIALNISNKLKVFHQSIGLPLFPHLASLPKEDSVSLTNKLLNQVLWSIGTLVILVVILAPPFIPMFFGERYQMAMVPFIFLTLAVIFDSLNKMIGYFFLGTGRAGMWSLQKLVDCIINASFLYMLIPVMGITGGGIAQLMGAAITFLVAYLFYRRDIKMKVNIFQFDYSVFKKMAINLFWNKAKKVMP